ncbi:hypothetical protein ASF40_20620 [Microbacterium sp. Leaf288]|uniref:inositol monophosphatase family protein n=1 Tax=Microbacterium sp. Leaf288 TaxID=1736323 RepID=UPI0006F2CEF7|nr:inositol monophosphatase family protein [Microbacterium sp. Leaf288]KQP72990.1 hypothetical protein ASF40_20620 [Microbacterium sp. Leaf288]
MDDFTGRGDLSEMLEFAERLAREVGRQARRAALDPADATMKAHAADWVTPIDVESEARIRHAITSRYPYHAIIGEELSPHGDADASPLVWHIDPIDGTTNFVFGLGNVSVSIGAVDDVGPAIGAVHDIYRDETVSAARGLGVRVNGELARIPTHTATLAGQVLLTEWSGGYHRWAGFDQFLDWTTSSQVTVRIIGSCALALAHAGLGRAAATILPARHNSWDLAAGIVIASEGRYRLMGVDGDTRGLPSTGLLVAAPAVADEMWAAWRRSVADSAGR